MASIIERVWDAAHAGALPPWSFFQCAAVAVGALVVGRRQRVAFAVGIACAAILAITFANGGDWVRYLASLAAGHSSRDRRAPDLEVAGIGALAGLVVGHIAVARARRLALGPLLDELAPAVGAMLAIARLGCFFAGCDFGKPSSLPWAISYPHLTPAFRAQLDSGLVTMEAARTLPVHPTQLYESLLGVVLFLVALALRRIPPARGRRFTIVAAGYAVGRIAIDTCRGDLPHDRFGLTPSQLLAMAMLGLVAAFAWSPTIHPTDPPALGGARH